MKRRKAESGKRKAGGLASRARIELRFLRPVRRQRLRRRLCGLVRRLRGIIKTPIRLQILVVPHDSIDTEDGFGFGVYLPGGPERSRKIVVATNRDMDDATVAETLCHEVAHYEQEMRGAVMSERDAERRARVLVKMAWRE